MIAVIPMAGRGSRFANDGYNTPKPLISVLNRLMVFWALDGLRRFSISKYIFIILQEHEERFQVSRLIRNELPIACDFIFLDAVTDGQLSTVLAARHLMDEDEDLLVASADTLVVSNLQRDISLTHWDGIISVADLAGDQWSFAKTNEDGQVIQVAEKVRISNNASTGLYYFRKSRYLVEFGEMMIARQERTRGEYYVIPVYQQMINAGLKVGIAKADEMWDMGTPAAKAKFEKYYVPGI